MADDFSDDDLRKALQHREPPEGFAERTLARVGRREDATTPQSKSVPGGRWIGWTGFAIAASIVVVVGGVQFRAYQKEAQAKKAAQELTLAMRITSDTLREVQNKVVNRRKDQ